MSNGCPTGLITNQDLVNAKTDADSASEWLESENNTLTTRLGTVQRTVTGANNDIDNLISSGEQDIQDAIENTIGKSYIGPWTALVTEFTTMNEYSDYNGVTYKPKSGITLPYTAQGADPTALPDSDFVEPFSDVNSSNLGALTDYVFASVDDMIAGTVIGGGAITHAVGDQYSSGGTVWRVNTTPVTSIYDFTPLTAIAASDFVLFGDGLGDDYQASFDAIDTANLHGVPVVFPEGEFRLSQRVEILSPSAQTTINIRMSGAGDQKTKFIVDGSENSTGGLSFVKVGTFFYCHLSDFSVVAKSNSGDCGVGINLSSDTTGANLFRQLLLTRVSVTTEDALVTDSGGGVYVPATPAFFSTGFLVNRCNRLTFTSCLYAGPKSSTVNDSIRYADAAASYLAGEGYKITDSYGPLLEKCQAHQVKVGFAVITDTLNIEGANFNDCVAVNVQQGCWLFKTVGSLAGTEPAFSWIGGHVNFRDYGVRVQYRKNCEVASCLFHMQNTDNTIGVASPTDIYVQVGNTFNIHNNIFHFGDTRVERRAIQFDDIGTGGETNLNSIIEGNQFNATMGYAIRNNVLGTHPQVGDNYYKSGVVVKFSSDGNKPVPFTDDNYTLTYTPVITNEVGCSVSPQALTYTVNSGVVRVTGRININSNAANTINEFDMSAPVPTDLLNDRQASGTVSAVYTAIPDSSTGIIFGNATDDTLSVQMVAKSSSNTFCYIDISYDITQA